MASLVYWTAISTNSIFSASDTFPQGTTIAIPGVGNHSLGRASWTASSDNLIFRVTGRQSQDLFPVGTQLIFDSVGGSDNSVTVMFEDADDSYIISGQRAWQWNDIGFTYDSGNYRIRLCAPTTSLHFDPSSATVTMEDNPSSSVTLYDFSSAIQNHSGSFANVTLVQDSVDGLSWINALAFTSNPPTIYWPHNESANAYLPAPGESEDVTIRMRQSGLGASANTFILTVQITEPDLQPSFGTASIDAQTFTQDEAITNVTLPEATSGDAPITYSITPTLPAGLTLTGRVLSGTPTAAQTATDYTYTATDSDGDTATISFSITINDPPDPFVFTETSANVNLSNGNSGTVVLYTTETTGEVGSVTGYRVSATPAIDGFIIWLGQIRYSANPTNNANLPAVGETVTVTIEAFDEAGNTTEEPFVLTVTITAHDHEPTFGTAAVNDQNYEVGVAIPDLTLPQATSGNAPLTYALSPALPSGLTRADRVISGTPDTAAAETEYTWTVTDNDGDTESLTFNITVLASSVPFVFDPATANTNLDNTTSGSIDIITVSAAEVPFAGSIVYSLTGTVQQGFSIGSSTGTISYLGNAANNAALPAVGQSFLIIASAANDIGITSNIFVLTVTVVEPDTAPDFGSSTVVDQTWQVDSAITDLTLPAATGGNGTITYSLSPALPTGITRNGRVLSGTPTAVQAQTTYVWTATDADSDFDTLLFNVTVEAAPPDFEFSPATATAHLTNGTSGNSTLYTVSTTGGVGTVTYSLVSPVQQGISINSSTGVIQFFGSDPNNAALPAVNSTFAVVVSATDDNGAATNTFTLTVTVHQHDYDPTFGSSVIGDQTYQVNTAINDLTLPAATSGNPPLTYSLSPALPAGLSRTDRVISGTPTAEAAQTAYTWTVTDNDSDTASLTFNITVQAAPPPFVFSPATASTNLTNGHTTTVTLFTVSTSGATGAVAYAIVGTPQQGVSINSSTGAISYQGNAANNAALPSTGNSFTVTVSATDTTGSADNQFVLTVTIGQHDFQPAFPIVSIAHQAYTQYVTITNLTLPAASGGNLPLTYSLSPALPAGLSRSGQVISGTPTAALTSTTYTWTVNDADSDTDSVTFTMAVAAAQALAFTQTSAAVTITNGNMGTISLYSVSANTVAGAGNNVYSIVGTPQQGVRINEATGALLYTANTANNAQLPAAGGSFTVTVSVSNDYQTAATNFVLTVNVSQQDLQPSFGTVTIPALSYRAGTVVSYTLPAATGGNAPLAYSISPALPSGLTLSGRVIGGTVAAAVPQATYTWTVSDADSDTDTVNFTLEITAPAVTEARSVWRTPRHWEGQESDGSAADRLGEWNASRAYGQKIAYQPNANRYDLTFEWSELLQRTLPALAVAAGDLFVGSGMHLIARLPSGSGAGRAYRSNGTTVVIEDAADVLVDAYPTSVRNDLIVGNASARPQRLAAPTSGVYILHCINGIPTWRDRDGNTA